METEDRIVYTKQKPKPETASSKYDAQALAWLEKTDSQIEIEYDRTDKYFDDDDDKDLRDIYSVTLWRGSTHYTFTFGQSLSHSAPWVHTGALCRTDYSYDNHFADDSWKRNPNRAQPSAYSILSSLAASNPGSYEEWCSEFGYDTDSRKAEKTWRACVEQYLALDAMYSREELNALAEIN